MKLTIFLFLFSFACAAQEAPKQDTLAYQFKHMQVCLRKCHKEFTAGATVAVFSGLAAGIGYRYPAAAVAGGIGMLIGTLIMMDSHKWIERSTFAPAQTGLGIAYRF
jgi:hypothetical protein